MLFLFHGNTSLSILSLEGSNDGSVFSVLATNGNTHLGGEDFDLRVVDYFAS